MRAAIAILLITAACSQTVPPDLAVQPAAMTPAAHEAETTLRFERSLDDGASFTAYLVSYRHAGLRLRAMVAVPRVEMPESGFPLVVANHGYVPDPRRYGITSDGRDSRPGDYYRSVPELFTSRGFMAVIPDYRGHNSSEGFEFIDPQDANSMAYYAEDVAALLAGLGSLREADVGNVFMWSHSMGGPVSLRALVATDIVRAASFWSTMNVDDLLPDASSRRFAAIVHHAVDDATTEHANSESLAARLASLDRLHAFHSYTGDNHYFDEAERKLAADRDAAFFCANMRGPSACD